MTGINIQKTPQKLPTNAIKQHETTVSVLGQKIIVSVASYEFFKEVKRNLFTADNSSEKLKAARFILEGHLIIAKQSQNDLLKQIIIHLAKNSLWLSQVKIDEPTQILIAQAVAEEVYTDFKFLTFEDIALAIKLGAKGKFKDKGDVLYLSPQMIYSWIETYNEKIKVPAAKLVVEAKEKINYQKATEIIQNKGESQKGILETILKIAKNYQQTGSYEHPNLPVPEAATSLEALYYKTLEELKIVSVNPQDKWVIFLKNVKKTLEEVKNNPIVRMQKEAKQFINSASLFLENPTEKDLLDYSNNLFVLARTRSQAESFELCIKHGYEVGLLDSLEKHINAWKQS